MSAGVQEYEHLLMDQFIDFDSLTQHQVYVIHFYYYHERSLIVLQLFCSSSTYNGHSYAQRMHQDG